MQRAPNRQAKFLPISREFSFVTAFRWNTNLSWKLGSFPPSDSCAFSRGFFGQSLNNDEPHLHSLPKLIAAGRQMPKSIPKIWLQQTENCKLHVKNCQSRNSIHIKLLINNQRIRELCDAKSV